MDFDAEERITRLAELGLKVVIGGWLQDIDRYLADNFAQQEMLKAQMAREQAEREQERQYGVEDDKGDFCDPATAE